jgi:hypothetical protein
MNCNCQNAGNSPVSPNDSYRSLIGLDNTNRMVARQSIPGPPYTHVAYDDGSTTFHNQYGEPVSNDEVAPAFVGSLGDSMQRMQSLTSAIGHTNDPATLSALHQSLNDEAQRADLLKSMAATLHQSSKSMARFPQE